MPARWQRAQGLALGQFRLIHLRGTWNTSSPLTERGLRSAVFAVLVTAHELPAGRARSVNDRVALARRFPLFAE
jgi:hypothetical protein